MQGRADAWDGKLLCEACAGAWYHAGRRPRTRVVMRWPVPHLQLSLFSNRIVKRYLFRSARCALLVRAFPVTKNWQHDEPVAGASSSLWPQPFNSELEHIHSKIPERGSSIRPISRGALSNLPVHMDSLFPPV